MPGKAPLESQTKTTLALVLPASSISSAMCLATPGSDLIKSCQPVQAMQMSRWLSPNATNSRTISTNPQPTKSGRKICWAARSMNSCSVAALVESSQRNSQPAKFASAAISGWVKFTFQRKTPANRCAFSIAASKPGLGATTLFRSVKVHSLCRRSMQK